MKTTYHECTNAGHIKNVGATYWATLVDREMKNGNNNPYGNVTETNAGYIGIGEIWGNYFGARCEHEKFGDNGDFYPWLDWYHPGFFMELRDEYGFSDQELFSCLSSGINIIPKLRDELHWKFPLRTTQINSKYEKFYP